MFSSALTYVVLTFSLPPNIKCSNRCANPVSPGFSFLDPTRYQTFTAMIGAFVILMHDERSRWAEQIFCREYRGSTPVQTRALRPAVSSPQQVNKNLQGVRMPPSLPRKAACRLTTAHVACCVRHPARRTSTRHVSWPSFDACYGVRPGIAGRRIPKRSSTCRGEPAFGNGGCLDIEPN